MPSGKSEHGEIIGFAVATEMVRMRAVDQADVARSATDLRGFLPIDGVGHWPQLEATDVVNDALLGFLRSAKH